MVDELSRPGPQCLARIWKVVILGAQTGVFPISHEDSLLDRRKRDLAFQMTVDGRMVQVLVTRTREKLKPASGMPLG